MSISLECLFLFLHKIKTQTRRSHHGSLYRSKLENLSYRLGLSQVSTGKELEKRPYAPGPHGPGQRKKISEYSLQLQEKQKLRHMYGVTERQFRNLFVAAGKLTGKHGENFMILLEARLDNLVYRMGLFSHSSSGYVN